MRDSTGSARYMIPTPVVKPQAARPDLFSCVQDMQHACRKVSVQLLELLQLTSGLLWLAGQPRA